MTKKKESKEVIVTQGSPDVIYNNTLTIDKNEMINLMICEKEELLESELAELEKAIRQFQFESGEGFIKPSECFKKTNADTLAKIQPIVKQLFGDYAEVSIRYEYNISYTPVNLQINYKYEKCNNANMKNEFFKISITPVGEETEKFEAFIKERIDTYNANKKLYEEKKEELKNLPKKAKQLRAAAVKKALEQTEDGRDILDYFRRLRDQASQSPSE
jgi:hypothetical protein